MSKKLLAPLANWTAWWFGPSFPKPKHRNDIERPLWGNPSKRGWMGYFTSAVFWCSQTQRPGWPLDFPEVHCSSANSWTLFRQTFLAAPRLLGEIENHEIYEMPLIWQPSTSRRISDSLGPAHSHQPRLRWLRQASGTNETWHRRCQLMRSWVKAVRFSQVYLLVFWAEMKH